MPGMQPFQQAHPKISINWLTTNTVVIDVDTECDVAIWWKPPSSPTTVGNRLGGVRYSLFTTPAYEGKFGLPTCVDDFARHRFMTFNGYEINPRLAPWNDLMRRFPPALRVENALASETILNTHSLITLLPDYVGHLFPQCIRLPLDLGIRLEVWLAYHEDRRRDPVIRAIAKEIGSLAERGRGHWFT